MKKRTDSIRQYLGAFLIFILLFYAAGASICEVYASNGGERLKQEDGLIRVAYEETLADGHLLVTMTAESDATAPGMSATPADASAGSATPGDAFSDHSTEGSSESDDEEQAWILAVILPDGTSVKGNQGTYQPISNGVLEFQVIYAETWAEYLTLQKVDPEDMVAQTASFYYDVVSMPEISMPGILLMREARGISARSVHGVVFLDFDEDGKWDGSSDHLISGVKVELHRADGTVISEDCNGVSYGTVLSSTIAYEFNNIPYYEDGYYISFEGNDQFPISDYEPAIRYAEQTGGSGVPGGGVLDSDITMEDTDFPMTTAVTDVFYLGENEEIHGKPMSLWTIHAGFVKASDAVYTYKSANLQMGSVSLASETVSSVNGTLPNGSSAIPLDGYIFVKWVDKNGITVSTSPQFTPSKVKSDEDGYSRYSTADYEAVFAKKIPETTAPETTAPETTAPETEPHSGTGSDHSSSGSSGGSSSGSSDGSSVVLPEAPSSTESSKSTEPAEPTISSELTILPELTEPPELTIPPEPIISPELTELPEAEAQTSGLSSSKSDDRAGGSDADSKKTGLLTILVGGNAASRGGVPGIYLTNPLAAVQSESYTSVDSGARNHKGVHDEAGALKSDKEYSLSGAFGMSDELRKPRVCILHILILLLALFMELLLIHRRNQDQKKLYQLEAIRRMEEQEKLEEEES